MDIFKNKTLIINGLLTAGLVLGLFGLSSLSPFYALEHYHTKYVANTQADKLAKFKQKYKLVFFFAGDCGYCHKFAPKFKSFISNNEIEVEAVTADGGKINGFNWAEYNPTKIDNYGVESFPTVLVVNKRTNRPDYVFSQGNVSGRQLNRNLNALLSEL